MTQRSLLIIVFTILSPLLPICGYTSTSEISSSPTALYLFLEQVWQTNPGIHSAEAAVNAATANASALGRPLYNPELEFDGEHVRNDEQDDLATVGLSQKIDLFGKRAAISQVGQTTLSEALSTLAAQKLSIGIAALVALEEYNTSHQIAELAKKRTDLLKKFVEQTEKKYNAGDLGQAALDQSKLALLEAITQQAATEVALSLANEALVALTNCTTNTWPALSSALPLPAQLPSDVTELLLQHPTIQILTYRVNTANARIKVAKTNTRPDPTISFRGGQEDRKALFGLTVNIPLFIRNNFHDQVTKASEEAIATELTKLNTYWQAKARLEGTVNRYHLLFSAYKQWRRISAGSLDSGLLLLDKLWDAGEINTTEYLIQLKQRIDSQIAGVELENQAWQAWFQWLNASGSLDCWLNLSALSHQTGN